MYIVRSFDSKHENAVYVALRSGIPYTRIFSVGRPCTYYSHYLPNDVKQWAKRIRRPYRVLLK